jgi:hypothetical protein
MFRVLKEEELKQLPYGNKICKVLNKFQKIWQKKKKSVDNSWYL